MITSLTIQFPCSQLNWTQLAFPPTLNVSLHIRHILTVKFNHQPLYHLQILPRNPPPSPSSLQQLIINMSIIAWWGYLLIGGLGIAIAATGTYFVLYKKDNGMFSPEVDAKFCHMAESVCIVCHQHLAYQQAQEITWNHHTAPVHPSSIKLNTFITTPTPAHASHYHVNCAKCHGHIFTPVNFNIRTSSQYYAPHSLGYMIPPPSTYSALHLFIPICLS